MTVHAGSRIEPSNLALRHLGTGACGLGAILALAAIPALGDFAGSSGAAVADELSTAATRVQMVAIMSVVASAALLLAAVRVGRRIGGVAGAVATIAGSAVAVLLAAYYSAYAAGVVVGEYLLETTTPGLGESTLVVVNLVEMTRYAPGVALMAAAVAGHRSLPKGLSITAVLLLVLALLPMGSWVAALLIPAWLGVAGALSLEPRSTV